MAKGHKGGGLMGDFGAVVRDEVGDDKALKRIEQGWREVLPRNGSKMPQNAKRTPKSWKNQVGMYPKSRKALSHNDSGQFNFGL